MRCIAVSSLCVWRLGPLLDYRRNDAYRPETTCALRVEPLPDTAEGQPGGALLIATTGFALAAIRDPDGRIAKPITAMLPSRILDACAPPTIPTLYNQGDVELPETYGWRVPGWMRPHILWLTNVGCFVMGDHDSPDAVLPEEYLDNAPAFANAMVEEGKTIRPGQDYRLSSDYYDWRATLKYGPEGAPGRGLHINPALFQLFSRFTEGRANGLCLTQIDPPGGPLLLRWPDWPGAIGLIMPMRAPATPLDGRPSWWPAPAAGEQEGS